MVKPSAKKSQNARSKVVYPNKLSLALGLIRSTCQIQDYQFLHHLFHCLATKQLLHNTDFIFRTLRSWCGTGISSLQARDKSMERLTDLPKVLPNLRSPRLWLLLFFFLNKKRYFALLHLQLGSKRTNCSCRNSEFMPWHLSSSKMQSTINSWLQKSGLTELLSLTQEAWKQRQEQNAALSRRYSLIHPTILSSLAIPSQQALFHCLWPLT